MFEQGNKTLSHGAIALKPKTRLSVSPDMCVTVKLLVTTTTVNVGLNYINLSVPGACWVRPHYECVLVSSYNLARLGTG